MFFLHKNDIEDFQNRCVVAIFLDTHSEVELYEYIGKNYISGMFFNELHNIYFFNSPPNSTKNDVVFRYKNFKEKENVLYRTFNSGFISEYLIFVDNPFEYIKNNFEKRIGPRNINPSLLAIHLKKWNYISINLIRMRMIKIQFQFLIILFQEI